MADSEISENPLLNFEGLYKANFALLKEIEVSDANRMIERFKMTNDPVTWKIKLQKSFEDDQSFYNYSNHNRGMRRYRVDHHKNHSSLNYLKYREMLSKRK